MAHMETLKLKVRLQHLKHSFFIQENILISKTDSGKPQSRRRRHRRLWQWIPHCPLEVEVTPVSVTLSEKLFLKSDLSLQKEGIFPAARCRQRASRAKE